MTDQRDTYPLQWPPGWPRAKSRRSALYKVTLEKAVSEAVSELKRMGAKDVVMSSNMRVGLIRTTETEVKDPGVALYWTSKKGQPMVVACDCWHRLRDNVRAIGLTLSALRAIERCGASELLERAFTGFAALPAAPDCWAVLGVEPNSPREKIAARFRELGARHHPDRGGDAVTFKQISEAYHHALGAS